MIPENKHIGSFSVLEHRIITSSFTRKLVACTIVSRLLTMPVHSQPLSSKKNPTFPGGDRAAVHRIVSDCRS